MALAFKSIQRPELAQMCQANNHRWQSISRAHCPITSHKNMHFVYLLTRCVLCLYLFVYLLYLYVSIKRVRIMSLLLNEMCIRSLLVNKMCIISLPVNKIYVMLGTWWGWASSDCQARHRAVYVHWPPILCLPPWPRLCHRPRLSR